MFDFDAYDGGDIDNIFPGMSRPRKLTKPTKRAGTKRKKAVKTIKKPVLCRVKFTGDEWLRTYSLIVYKDGTARNSGDSAKSKASFFEWKIATSDLGPIFLRKGFYDDNWVTHWQSNDEDEVKIAETVVKALLDLEMDNLLTGRDPESTSPHEQEDSL